MWEGDLQGRGLIVKAKGKLNGKLQETEYMLYMYKTVKEQTQ